MIPDLELEAIPHVLDADEVPFVLGFASDRRRSLEIGGAEYRRGIDRVTIDWKLDALRLRAMVLNSDNNSFLMASVGPVLNEWWPLLRQSGGNAARPLLSAAVAARPQTFAREPNLSLNISVVPSGPGFDVTTAVTAIERAGALTDDSLAVAHMYSLAVIKAALLTLGEYRTLVDPIPDVHVEAGGETIPLWSLLDSAAEAAGRIAWSHSQD